eukprot:m.179996 g.179996  ORF g.179996 m.179996 type:complete len:218 (-) comp9989_c1_seq3:174-827(-)
MAVAGSNTLSDDIDDTRITMLPEWNDKQRHSFDGNLLESNPRLKDKTEAPEKIRNLLGLAALPVLIQFHDMNLIVRPDGIQVKLLLTHKVLDFVSFSECTMRGEPSWFLFVRADFVFFWDTDVKVIAVRVHAADRIEILVDGDHLHGFRAAKFILVCGTCTRSERHAHEAECGLCKRRIEVRDECPLDMVSITAARSCPTVLPGGQACPGRRNQDFW